MQVEGKWEMHKKKKKVIAIRWSDKNAGFSWRKPYLKQHPTVVPNLINSQTLMLVKSHSVAEPCWTQASLARAAFSAGNKMLYEVMQ